MAVHDEVLQAALRLCAERGRWDFTAEELVRALTHLNEHSVRTHLSSRCCVNAPHITDIAGRTFRRLVRGRYSREAIPRRSSRTSRRRSRLGERAGYGRMRARGLRDTIHAVLQRDGRHFVAECLEVAVVTQGRTADEVLANLEEAIALHLEGEDLRSLGLVAAPRLLVTYEVAMSRDATEA